MECLSGFKTVGTVAKVGKIEKAEAVVVDLGGTAEVVSFLDDLQHLVKCPFLLQFEQILSLAGQNDLGCLFSPQFQQLLLFVFREFTTCSFESSGVIALIEE